MEALSVFLRTLAFYLLMIWVVLIDLDRLLDDWRFALLHGLVLFMAITSLTIAYNL